MPSQDGENLPPPVFITSNDHSGYIVIVSALGMSFTCLCFLIRIYMRRSITGPFGHDDLLLSVATLFSVVQSASTFSSVSKGLGKSEEILSLNDVEGALKGLYAADILFIVVLYLSKCATAMLFLRLSSNKNHRRCSLWLLVLCTTWAFGAIFAIACRCDMDTPWDSIGAKCTNMVIRWGVVGAFDVITELMLFAMSIYLVGGLQMPTKFKGAVIGAFGFRLPMIAAVALRCFYIQMHNSSRNVVFEWVGIIILAQVEMNYSLVAATIPCLKPFMMACSTDNGAVLPRSAQRSASTSGKQRSRMPKGSSYILQSFGSSRRYPQRIPSHSDLRVMRGNKIDSVVGDVREDKHANASVDSNDSRRMIIRKDVEITVHRDGSEQGDN